MSTAELTTIQQTKFTLRHTVPGKLNTLLSDILTDLGVGMADATKESDARYVLKKYLMLNAVLIKPVRGGGDHQNPNINLSEKLKTFFIKARSQKCGKLLLKLKILDEREKSV